MDTKGGINVKDCELVSKRVSKMLDEKFEQDIPLHYSLEVSSPGIERPLLKDSDYMRFTGKAVRVKCKSLINDKKTHVGVLLGLDDSSKNVILKCGEEKVSIPISDISRCNIVWTQDDEGDD